MKVFGPVTYGYITLYYINGTITPDFFKKTPHSHDHCEIFIHQKGNMHIFVEKTDYIHSDKEIRVYAPHELHFGSCDIEQKMEWFQISIEKDFFIQNRAVGEIIFNRKSGTYNVFATKKHVEIASLASEIMEKIKENDPRAEQYFYANILRILCLLNEKNNHSSPNTKQNKSLQEIIRAINDNYPNIQTGRDICALSNFSSSHIANLFKKHLNTTPHQFVLIKKLNRACELLASGASVSDACFDSGFNNYNNFITLFRKTYGMTPNKYRNKLYRSSINDNY